MRRVLLCGVAVLLWLGVAPLTDAGAVPSHNHARDSIRVAGSKLRNGSGRSIQLRGVNRSGTEYACVQGFGIFDGPSDAASVKAIASWRVNVVRIPLNEDCWLGINGVKRAYAGANYRRAIISYVNLLHRSGMYAELSLMWAGPRDFRAT